MDELKDLYRLMNTVWAWMKRSIDTRTDEQWEKMLTESDNISNDPAFAPYKQVAIQWMLGFINYIEARNKA